MVCGRLAGLPDPWLILHLYATVFTKDAHRLIGSQTSSPFVCLHQEVQGMSVCVCVCVCLFQCVWKWQDLQEIRYWTDTEIALKLLSVPVLCTSTIQQGGGARENVRHKVLQHPIKLPRPCPILFQESFGLGSPPTPSLNPLPLSLSFPLYLSIPHCFAEMLLFSDHPWL